MNKQLIGVIALLIYACSTAISSLLTNDLEQVASPLLVASFSLFACVACFWAVNYSKPFIKLAVSQYPGTIIQANIATAIIWLAIFYGVKQKEPASFLALFFGTIPIATLLLSLFSGDKKPALNSSIPSSIILLIMIALSAVLYNRSGHIIYHSQMKLRNIACTN